MVFVLGTFVDSFCCYDYDYRQVSLPYHENVHQDDNSKETERVILVSS